MEKPGESRAFSFSPPVQGEGWVGMVLVLCFGFGVCCEDRLTSMCFSSAIPGCRLLSFACPKESRQRKGHPRGRGRWASMPSDSASRRRGSPTAHPCAEVELAGILPAIASRLILHLLAATERGPGRARARQSLPQKHRIYATRTYSSSPRKRGPSALALRVPSEKRRRADGPAACAARGQREGSRRFGQQGRDALWAEPVRP